MEANPVTLRQRRVLLLHVFRFTKQQIAEDIGYSAGTVTKDTNAIYKRLNVHCLPMALAMALMNEEITLADLRCFYYSISSVNNK